MAGRRCVPGGIVAALLALGASSILAACGHAANRDPAAVPAVSPVPGNSVSVPLNHASDIGWLDGLKRDFPDGFTVASHSPETLDQRDIDGSRIHAFSTAAVQPPQCRALLLPPYAVPSPGARAAALHAIGDRGAVYVIALRLPQPIAAGTPVTGCAEMTITGAPEVTGSAERIPAPEIAGAVTTGVRLDIGNRGELDYLYTAALDARTCIVVVGATDPELDARQLLSGLLVKAAAAVRGR